MRARIALLLPIFWIGIVVPGLAQATTSFWASNSFAMRLQPLSPTAAQFHSGFLLVHFDSRSTDNRRVEELRRAGEVLERTVRLYSTADSLIREERYESGVLVLLREHQPDRIIETTFDSDGQRSGTAVQLFGNDRLVRLERRDHDDQLLYHDEYRYSSDGSLRRVRRTLADGSVRDSVYGFSTHGLVNEWHGDGNRGTAILYDDSGRVVRREEWIDGSAVVVFEFFYQLNSRSPLRAEEQDQRSGARSVLRYDSAGRVISEQRTEPGREPRTIGYSYLGEGTTVYSRQLQYGNVQELWTFRHDADLTLIGEEFRRNSELVWVRQLLDGLWIEDRLRNGQVFLQVVYRGDQRIEERDIRDGQVIRTRSLVPAARSDGGQP